MRILTLTHVFPRWDDDVVAPFLLDRARLLARDHDVVVVAPHAPGLPERHHVAGVDVVRVRYGPDRTETIAYRGQMHRLVANPAGVVRLWRLGVALRRAVDALAARGGWDVLDVHWAIPTGLIAWRARTGLPLHLTLHGTDIALLGRLPGGRLVADRINRTAARVVAVSDGLADDARRVGFRVDGVVPMPLRAIAPCPGRSESGTVLSVGRLVPEKGHADLIAAVAGLGDLVDRVEIVGEGPQANSLARLARRHGVALDLPGPLAPADLDRRYAAAACVAVPSRREGLGLVALEAMLAGTPVVAARVGGLASTLGSDDAPRGFGFPPGDVAALTAALRAALTGEQAATRVRRALGHALAHRERAQHATADSLAAAVAAAA